MAGTPGMGARYEHEHPALADLRVVPVSRFKKYLVFYRSVQDGIEILRVLHGARDFHGLLVEGVELPEEDDDGTPTEESDCTLNSGSSYRYFAFPWLATAAAALATSSGSPR